MDICRNLNQARSSYYRRAATKAIDVNAVKLRAAVRHIHVKQRVKLSTNQRPIVSTFLSC